MIRLGYSGRSALSALKIAEASAGRITAVRSSDCDINWGRNRASRALNPDISNATNKRLMRELFADAGVPAPQLFTPDEARDALSSAARTGWGQPLWLIGRPDQHTRQRGMWLCESPRDVDRALRGTRRKKPATHFMEYIPAGREFRVHVLDGQSLRISQKRIDPDDPRKYTTIKPTLRRREHIRNAAKAAVEALGLDFGCVDILATGRQAWVLEVNTAPGVGGTMPTVWAEAFIRRMEDDE